MLNYVVRKRFCDTLTENVFTQRDIRNGAWIWSFYGRTVWNNLSSALCDPSVTQHVQRTYHWGESQW